MSALKLIADSAVVDAVKSPLYVVCTTLKSVPGLP